MNVFPLGNRGIGLLFFQTGIIGDSSVDAKVDFSVASKSYEEYQESSFPSL